MKNRNYFYQALLFTLSIALFLAMSQSAKAQSKVDLKELKLIEAADTITSSSHKLIKFFEDEKIIQEFEEVTVKGAKKENSYAKNQGEEIKSRLKKGYVSLLNLILTLKKANLWNEQFDKDVAKLISGGEGKTQLEKYGGARKLLESGVNLSSAAGLKKDIDEHANLFIWQTIKTKETCRYIAIGDVVYVLWSKKTISSTIKGGCKN